MFWCGVYNLYLIYTEMYLVDFIKFSLCYSKLLQKSLLNCYFIIVIIIIIIIIIINSTIRQISPIVRTLDHTGCCKPDHLIRLTLSTYAVSFL